MKDITAEASTSKKEQRPHLKHLNGHSTGGLTFPRMFSEEGLHPYDRLSWETRNAVISNEKGETTFEQKDVEVPTFWSQMATNVVVSKYFRATPGHPDRENSVRQLISRVADTITSWGRKDGYFITDEQAEVFQAELTTILVEQYAAFNSPVWFNVGVEENPQCSACFILSVEDSIDSLLDLQKTEARLFKYGSGSGSNLSNIRSSRETLSGGGSPSGPVSFMRGYDSWAGTIKSGGKTRRAAKMQILDVDHPDILEFVNAKRIEEQKAWALIEQGYDGGFNVPGGAYESVFFQNANLSVRVPDEFMQAVVDGKKFPTRKRADGAVVEELDARSILNDIAKGTWVCGDPGLQFDTVINDWHTCPNSGRISASNPCSEYMHIDDSACNLASINLLKFLNEDGSFDVERYKHTVDIMITAQDILIDNAGYPTEAIATNAKAFRQLGLGYANLGALLMSLGIPYDSDEGRSIAASLMSVLTGESYLMSAKLAEKLGAFNGYEVNKLPMLRVIKKHEEASLGLDAVAIFDTLVEAAQKVWTEAYKQGVIYGYRNSQATVLAPTGTIAFLMDCDTTGIEPDIALVKYKKLVGGGLLKIVNHSVPRALKALRYNEHQIKEIINYIDENDTIEGAPGLMAEHLPVFDCAFRPLKGSRSIHYQGHIKMMGAVQPFVSGAISKTVNLPESATVQDIYNTYLKAWRLGIKAIAIYRDNSKRSQPLATMKDEAKSVAASAVEVKRRHLPEERQAITHKFSVAGHEGYITVGLYEDGSPGEIFLVMAKEGSTLSGVTDAFATSISLALQYGVPLSALVKKFSHMRFEPSGFTPNKQIPIAKSILDYIFRWLAIKFLSKEEQTSLGIIMQNGDSSTNDDKQQSSPQHVAFQISEDAPPCATCGSSLMVRQGPCYRCLNCGSQGGCG
jgi:ribonucleoside-diphosphate reductase alpha chain